MSKVSGVIALLLLLTGCGFKGPLQLPGDGQSEQQSEQQQEQAE